MTTRDPADIQPRGHGLIPILVASAFFMELLDGTVIATALPKIAVSFHREAVDLDVGISAYMLTLGVFIPVSGWVADRFGTRSVFGAAIALFTISSLCCGASFDLWSFTISRILQGIGGAMMVPVGRLVVLRTTAKKDLMQVFAMIVWPGLMAPVIGPALGGFIATYFSWRWIFLLNAPLGVIAIAINFLLIPNFRSNSVRRLDLLGFLLSGVAVVAFIYGLDAVGGRHSVESGVALMGVGLIAAGLTWLHFRRVATPLLEFDALAQKTFRVYARGGSLFRIAFGTAPFLLPLMFQVVFGLSPVDSGILVMSIFAGNIAIKPLTTPLVRRFGFKNIIVYNNLLVSLSHFACGLFAPSTPHAVILLVLCGAGACRSVQFTALNTLQFADISPAEMSGANTLSSTIAQITMGVGVSIGALAIDFFAWLRGASHGALALSDFRWAFFAIGAVSLVSTLDYISLPKDAGNAVARRGAGASETA